MKDDEHRAGLDSQLPEPPPRPPTGIPEGFEPVIAGDFDSYYGLEVLDDGTRDGRLRGRVAIRDELRQPLGPLHGGVISAMAEALASRGPGWPFTPAARSSWGSPTRRTSCVR